MAGSDPEPTGPTGRGSRLVADRYRLISELGGGSMGTVWMAHDELLRRQVAIKEVRLPAGLPEEQAAEVRERALREARAIAALNHPNVVTLYDVARHDGEPYVVMEYVPSYSLGSLLHDHGPLAPQQLAAVGDSVAAALDIAHHNGITHRDVKPGNVLVSESGLVKLSDFGIARNVADKTLTSAGIMLGTPAYIAPEVASGGNAGPAADLWGLGATLYAATVGEPPYDRADNPMATIHAVVYGPVPEPPGDGPISEVVAGLLVKDPASRMPLPEVRRRMHPLLPAADEALFANLFGERGTAPRPHRTTEFGEPADASAHAPAEPPASSPAAEPSAHPEPSVAHAQGAAGELASDPGPLPFTPTPSPPRRRPIRRALTTFALAACALLLFLFAAAGAFTGVRVLARQPVLPTSPGGPLSQLSQRTDDLRVGTLDNTGRFALPVPNGWATFHGQRADGALANRSAHFVSADGTMELAVLRYRGFFAGGHRATDYLSRLPQHVTNSGDRYLPGPGTGPGNQGDHAVHYQVVSGPDGALRRSTVAKLVHQGGDLWVVRVTSPSDRAQEGQNLFDRVSGRFDVG